MSELAKLAPALLERVDAAITNGEDIDVAVKEVFTVLIRHHETGTENLLRAATQVYHSRHTLGVSIAEIVESLIRVIQKEAYIESEYQYILQIVEELALDMHTITLDLNQIRGGGTR